ncbi:hypothetical protein Tco_0489529 [Tanacetum coccineum]
MQLIQKLQDDKKCMKKVERSSRLKAIEDIISIGSFVEALVLNHYVLVRKILPHKRVRKDPDEYFSNHKIVEVVRVTTEQQHGLGFMEQIIMMRENDKPDSFFDADFKYLNKNEIKDMYYLFLNKKLGIESYQIKTNLTAPTLIFPGIKASDPYSIVDEPRLCLIYLNNKKEKRVMDLVEIVRFCDATLERVLKEVKLKIFETYIDPNPVYQTPLDDPILVRDAIFYERPSPKRLTKKCEIIVRDPFQMELSGMKLDFRKWETILRENVISLTGNKDHLNACLVYMLYCLATKKPLNLAYYMARRMVGVIKNDMMVLPYGMLLTRLYKHVTIIQPCPLTDGHLLTTHVMVPLTEGRVKRFLVDRKRPHPLTSSSSSSPQSQSHDQEQVDSVDNFELEPIEYSFLLEDLEAVPADYVSAGHILISADRYRIC